MAAMWCLAGVQVPVLPPPLTNAASLNFTVVSPNAVAGLLAGFLVSVTDSANVTDTTLYNSTGSGDDQDTVLPTQSVVITALQTGASR